MCLYVFVCVCMCACVFVCMCVSVHIYVFVCACMHVCWKDWEFCYLMKLRKSRSMSGYSSLGLASISEDVAMDSVAACQPVGHWGKNVLTNFFICRTRTYVGFHDVGYDYCHLFIAGAMQNRTMWSQLARHILLDSLGDKIASNFTPALVSHTFVLFLWGLTFSVIFTVVRPIFSIVYYNWCYRTYVHSCVVYQAIPWAPLVK